MHFWYHYCVYSNKLELSSRKIVEHSTCHATCDSACIFSSVVLMSTFGCTNCSLCCPVSPHTVLRCPRFTFYNLLPTINLLLSRLLTAVTFATLRVLHRQRLVHNPHISHRIHIIQLLCTHHITSHLCRQHACNSSIRQPARIPCRRSCCSIAARLVKCSSLRLPLGCNQSFECAFVRGLPHVFARDYKHV